jgi:hypothetical protein
MTTTGYGISGIGYPSMLGTYGLDTNGSFTSYDAYMPSNMGMNGSLFGANPMMGAYNPMMMGMYNPMFMAKMYQDYEASQVDHAANMHTKITNNNVQAYQETDLALVQKVATNGDVQELINTLHTKVLAGDQKGICNEYDKLRNAIMTTYRDELIAKGDKINPHTTTNRIIRNLYSSIVTAQNQANGISETADLEADIKKYGDGAVMNGFMTGLRSGHHDKYVDETLQYCFGYDIDRQEGKEIGKSISKGVGKTVSVLEKGVYGAGIGAAGYCVTTGVSKLLASCVGLGSKVKFNCKWLRGAVGLGMLAGMAADVIWQCTKD